MNHPIRFLERNRPSFRNWFVIAGPDQTCYWIRNPLISPCPIFQKIPPDGEEEKNHINFSAKYLQFTKKKFLTFSGFKSRWTTCNLWQYWIAVTIWRKYFLAMDSSRPPRKKKYGVLWIFPTSIFILRQTVSYTYLRVSWYSHTYLHHRRIPKPNIIWFEYLWLHTTWKH